MFHQSLNSLSTCVTVMKKFYMKTSLYTHETVAW